ncbi:hypothetical protein PC128_g2648 [Phytophthora cactorum]|nr:hypothetical protein PC128_g2648 [Phytophthora cactorum]
MESPSQSPRSHREAVDVSAEELLHPLEARMLHLSQELTTTDPDVPALSDDEVITKLNMIAETLEEVETNFRKERSSPYRRDGHLIGNLLQVLEQNEDFYPMLEGKLSDLSVNRVKAATCRLLLATVPVNSRAIVRVLGDDDEMLERVCGFATDTDPGLRCYGTGLLSVGLRDRSVADTVVNNDTPVKLLKRARMYASKLEKERQQAVKYIQDHLRLAASRHKKTINTGGSGATKATTPQRSLKRKHSDSISRAPSHGTEQSENPDTTATMEAEEEEPTATIPIQQSLPISANEEDVIGSLGEDGIVMPSPEHHEEDFKRLVMLELLYTLDCLGSMGEYLEIFAPALKEDIIGTIITFLHSKNPAVISHTMTLTSHFLAHKKFSFSLVEAGGVDLLFTVFNLQQAAGQVGLLDRSLSMCLHGFASSSAVVERLVVLNPDNMLSAAFKLLSSPNDRARQNAVVFFSLTLSFKVILDYFEKHNGLYTILNIIRVGNHPKSAAQRQLAQDACLCLRQYVRMHMALVTHRLRRKLAQLNHPSNRQSNTAPVLTAATVASRIPARVPKITWSKAIDLDDKTHEQNMVFYEKYRFSASSGNSNNSWSAASAGGGMWPPAAKLNHLRGVLVLLEVVALMCSVMQNTDPDANSTTIRIWTAERAQFCLDSLRVLTLVVPSLANEVCSTEVSLEEGASKKIGMTILLEIAMSSNPRDSELVRDALRVFCNCVSPPHHEDCWQHPLKDIRQYTLTARSMRTKKDDQAEAAVQGANTADNCSNCCSKAKDDKMLRPVRKLARERNAIKVCVYLLRYKRSVQNADAIRLLATRALLGLSRDRHISQILEKMQVGQLLSDMIRSDPVLEENADIHVRFRESALDLISHVTHRASNVVINEATDPTVRKIEKASIVANTKISYDENELLRLIHDHLVTKGLRHAASALVDEAKIHVDNSKEASSTAEMLASRANETQLNADQKGSTPHKKQVVVDQEVPSSVLIRRESGYLSEEETPRPKKLQRVSSLGSIVPELRKIQVAEGSHFSVKMSTPATHYHQSKKQMHQAFRRSHFFQDPTLTQSVTSPRVVSETTCPDALQKLPINARWSANSEAASVSPSSKLDEIITHFLREQHRQCANPVTTVPPFKLLGKGSLHRCPDPPATSSNLSICSRLLRRSRTGYRVGSSAFSSYYADAGIDRYVFSRYRPYRTVGAHVGSFAWGGVSVARFFGPNQQEMLIGNHDGELRQFNINSDEVVEEWTCHSPSSAIVNLETNEATSMGLQSRLILTGAVALSELAVNEIALWDANDTSALVERWRFQGGLRPEFNHYGDRIVALDVRSNEEADGLGFTVKGAVVVDIATGDVLCDLKDAMRSNDYGAETNCCFSPCDGTILTDGMMWDARIPTRALYKFDKLSNFGCGFFHPNGNEVIVNSAVWDLRTYRLLRMVPALDKCSIKFNPSGSVLFAYYPYAGGDYLERRKTKLKSWFRVLDARDYRDITTIDLGRPVFDLCLNTKSTLLSAVEGRYLEAGDVDDDDSICRLYDIGRKRPAEDDSDAEDGQDESDTLDDDEYDDESSSGGDEMEEETDESDEETSESEEVDSSEEEDEDAESDDDAAAHILAIEEDSDEDGNGSILSTRDLGYLLELPDTTYYECKKGAAIYLSDSMATKPEVDVEALGDKPVLLKRKDFLGTEKAAQSHPNRTYYYRQPTDLQRVIDTSTSHLVREPKDVKVLLARGQALFKQANYEQTIRDLNEVVALDSSNAAAFYTRGLAYSKLDNVELAIRDFSRTLQINPEHVNAAYARASCYNSQGDFVRAIDDYNFALLKDKKLKLQQKHQQELHRSATLSRQQLQRQKQQQESASNALLFTQRVKKTSTVPLAETDNNAEGLRQEEKAAESSVDSRVQSLSKLSVTSAPAKTLSATRTAVLPPPSPATVSVEQRHTTEPGVNGSQISSSSALEQAEVHHARGFQYRQECNFQAAADEYSRAIQLNPHHFKAYFNRGFVYDKMRRFDAAVEDYTQALEMDPHNAFALYNRGISLDRSGDYQGALADFTRAIELLPTNADFYHNRGFCHRKQGNFELAIADYSRAIEFNPDHFKSLYNRAYSYDKLGRYEDAAQDYTAALRVEPENANAYHNRGSTYDKMKDTTRAIADFDRAITLQPRSVSSYNSRGLCHDQLGRHEEALQDFAKALALDPRSAVFYHNRGYCLRNMGRFEEAVQDYSSALALEPRNVAAYNNRGYALRKLRRFKEAVADYTTALAIDPQNTRTLSNRAYSLAKMHHIEQAIADYTQVLTLDPQNSYSRHNRAILTAKMKGGDVDERDLK